MLSPSSSSTTFTTLILPSSPVGGGLIGGLVGGVYSFVFSTLNTIVPSYPLSKTAISLSSSISVV